MNKGLVTLALIAALAGCTQGPRPNRLRPTANPSAVIAAELAFAKLAQDKGQWTAFRATAAPDAVMFVPQMVQAQKWLAGRADPPVAVKWQPHQSWSSCDGSIVVTHGAWQRPTTVGYFSTIWRREANGTYKWVFDHGDTLALPLDPPEMISATVADCPKAGSARASNAPRRAAPAPFDARSRDGRSDDGTLTWSVTAEPDGAHNLSVDMLQDGKIGPALIEQVSAAAG